MRYILSLFSLMYCALSFSQTKNDEIILLLIEQYTAKKNIKCDILINVDVDGIYIPDKKLFVEFNEHGKPKVNSEGLALLPKKGTINQFNELLTTPLQAIFMSKKENLLTYKLVSLDSNSDWITADLTFDESSLKIYESIVSTRKHGEFHTKNTFKDNIYPSKSIITFNVKKFKMPLKFIGRQEANTSNTSKNQENVLGIITLTYTYFK